MQCCFLHSLRFLLIITAATINIAAMSSKKILKMKKIINVLDHYYPNPPVPLNSINDFTFLVAVVLSAQTTDGKVNDVTNELFRIAKTPEDMRKLKVSQVQKIIQPVGLAPKKAEYIVGLSNMLVEKFSSRIPNNYEDLESLPGIGCKCSYS